MNETISPPDTAADLPTALDLATQKAQFDETPTTTAFLKRIRNKERVRYGDALPELRNGQQIPVTAITVEIISWASSEGKAFVSPEEFEKLVELEIRMRATLAKAEQYSPSKVSDYLNQKRDELQGNTLAGKELPMDLTPSRGAVAHDFQVKQSALTQSLLRICAEECVPLCKPILGRFQAALENFLRYREFGDREIAVAYDLPFETSIIWKAAARIFCDYSESRLPLPHAFSFPSTILAGVVNFNQ